MQQDIKTVYLAGKITNDPHFREKFAAATETLENAGFIVCNPAILPGGFSHEQYMRMTKAMLDECDAVAFLPDWPESEGAQFERGRAEARGKIRIEYLEWRKQHIVEAEAAPCEA